MCKVSDVASLITMSSENHSLMALPLQVSHSQTLRVNTSKLGQLTCFTSLRDIVNIAKYTGNIHVMFVAGVVTKRKGFSSVLILSKKKPNQHRILHLDPQRLGQSHYNKEMVVINCMNIPKYTHISEHISFKWRVEKDNIDLR